MRGPRNRYHSRAEIEPQEFELIAKVAQAFRTTEREELQAELARRLLDLKRNLNPAIRNWNAYRAKFLYNKASDWVDAERRRERRTPSLDAAATDDSARRIPEPREKEKGAPTLPLALTDLWGQLGPELKRFWIVLAEEDGNQSKAARRLNIHRNTARQWRSRILQILERHGFEPP